MASPTATSSTVSESIKLPRTWACPFKIVTQAKTALAIYMSETITEEEDLEEL